jgi:serine/threonine protein kinase
MSDTPKSRDPEPARESRHNHSTVSFRTERLGSTSVSLVLDDGLEEDASFPAVQKGELIGGKYILDKPIGQGGMGTVWRAEQLTPLNRTVAIKFLRDNLQRRQAVPRFAVEQQVLASMSHPNIASIFDSGLTDDHMPYLVMEFVDGPALNLFCDHHRLTIAERLRLIVTTCLAVEHAHQRGIIHRDLKPSNILVAMADAVPILKVIDFGLAKPLPWSACGGDSADKTLPGDAIGTPLYMAPEQITSPDTGIDTRADVYAVGVILYLLMTGELPFPPCPNEDGGWLQTLHTIVHEEPARPSQRASTLTNEAAIAKSRHVAVGELSKAIRGDLDCIILKAIAKQPSDRYASVSALRKDIQRYLNKQPIHARPATLAYRASRFFSRHRVLVCLGTLLGVVLVGGLAATSWALLRAHAAAAAAREALASERKANDRTKRAIAMLAASLCDEAHGDSCGVIAFRQIVALHDVASNDDDPPHGHVTLTAAGPSESGEAIAVYRHVLELLDRLHREQPLTNYRCLAVSVRTRLGQELEAAGYVDLAIKEYQLSETVLKQLVAEYPANADYRRRLAAVQQLIEACRLPGAASRQAGQFWQYGATQGRERPGRT